MDKIFDLSEYSNGKYGMHCSSEQNANAFLQFLDHSGRCWSSGNRYVDFNSFNIYGSNTVYLFNAGQYCSKLNARNIGYTVLEFEDFIFPSEPHDALSQDDISAFISSLMA